MCETSHINSRNLLDFPFSIRQVVSKFHIWWVGWYFIIRKINSGIKPVKTDFCFMCCFNKELKSIPLVIFPIKTQMFPLYWAFARSEKVLGNSAPSQFALWKKRNKTETYIKEIHKWSSTTPWQPMYTNEPWRPMKALYASLRIISHTTLRTLKGCHCCMWNRYHQWSRAQK